MASPSLVIISGIAPGRSGMGRVLSQLVKENTSSRSCHILWGRYGYSIKYYIFKKEIFLAMKDIFYWLRAQLFFHTGYLNSFKNRNVLLIHPQSLGFQWCLNFLRNSKKPVWLFLTDSSFFCIRSYNYIPSERTACIRCIEGKFDNIEKNNCKPLPPGGDVTTIIEFLKMIRNLGKNQKIKFIAQNKEQLLLARKHFGDNAIINISGLFIDEWTSKNTQILNNNKPEYDIVFHGHPIPAKGLYWALELASHLPQYRFLFPFSPPQTEQYIPSNCCFEEISWETGLRELIISTNLVLVPSLWSAPIEGALIKSIAYGKTTAVVENETAFSNEIPQNVIYKLPNEPKRAAMKIKSLFAGNNQITKEAKQKFLTAFWEENKGLLQKFIKITANS